MTIEFQQLRFKNKIVIITGAASGIGKAILNRFVYEGGTVIGIDINNELMLETVKEIKEKKYIGTISFKIACVSNELQVKKVINEIVEEYEKIDILINMAGILTSSK